MDGRSIQPFAVSGYMRSVLSRQDSALEGAVEVLTMATGTDPFADLLTLQRDVDRVMTTFGGQPRQTEGDGRAPWTPAVDVFRQGQGMVVRVELPRVAPTDISVSVAGNVLAIRGERREDSSVGAGDYVMHESARGKFERRITMPQDVDASQVRAQYRTGVLEIAIPASALVGPQARQVQVGASQQAAGAQGAQSTPSEQQMATSYRTEQASVPTAGQQQTPGPGSGSQQPQETTRVSRFGAWPGTQR